MNAEQLRKEAKQLTVWQRHRFLVMIAGVIVISLGLISVSLYLYNASGVAQIDLSRPENKEVNEQLQKEKDAFAKFPATGKVDAAVLDEFDKLYEERAAKVLNAGSFNPDVLNDDTLQVFGAPGNDTAEAQ